MIRLGKYGIDVSERCYRIGKIATVYNKKDKKHEEILADAGYYSTIETALKAVYKRMTSDTLATYDGDLKGAVVAIRKCTDEFKKLVEDAFPNLRIIESEVSPL